MIGESKGCCLQGKWPNHFLLTLFNFSSGEYIMNDNIITEFIQYNRETLDLIMDLVPIPLFVKDRAGLYIDCNKSFMEFLSISREEIIGKSVYEIWSKNEADVFFAQDEALFHQGGIQIYEANITSSTGVAYIAQFHKQVFTDSTGAITGFLGAIFDITEKKELECALEKLAVIDELTDLTNRRDGMAKLEALHEESERKKQPYCIAMIDLDGFKQINDQYGHHTGDTVLKEFADLTKKFLRRNDVCFRYGGEEFVMLLPETELNDGFAVVERLRKAWTNKKVALSKSQFLHSTISIGIAQYDTSSISYMQLLQISDKALYLAKNGGKNCSVCIRSDLNSV
jgi:PAS domain S-box/diguanylate cyclase (GGDEF) domain